MSGCGQATSKKAYMIGSLEKKDCYAPWTRLVCSPVVYGVTLTSSNACPDTLIPIIIHFVIYDSDLTPAQSAKFRVA